MDPSARGATGPPFWVAEVRGAAGERAGGRAGRKASGAEGAALRGLPCPVPAVRRRAGSGWRWGRRRGGPSAPQVPLRPWSGPEVSCALLRVPGSSAPGNRPSGSWLRPSDGDCGAAGGPRRRGSIAQPVCSCLSGAKSLLKWQRVFVEGWLVSWLLLNGCIWN